MKPIRFLFFFAFLLAACGGASLVIPTSTEDARQDFYNEITATAEIRATQLALPTLQPSGWEVLSANETIALYQFFTDPATRLEGSFCLWSEVNGYVQIIPISEQVNSFANALISPDETTLVYAPYVTEQNLAELWVIEADGTGNRQLLTVEDFIGMGEGFARAIPLQMLWLPGTSQIIFNTSEFNYKGLHLNDLHQLDIETGELTTIAPTGEGGFFALSPDGAALALVRPDSADAYLIDGWQKRSQVVYPPTVGLSSEDVYPSVAWLADNSAFHVAVPALGEDPEDGELVFYQIMLDGRPAEEVLRVETGRRPPTRPVYFSPDGAWAVFEAAYAETMVAAEIHLVKLDGSAHFKYEAEAYFHEWRPDSDGFVFITPTGLVLADLAGEVTPYTPTQPDGPALLQPWTEDCAP